MSLPNVEIHIDKLIRSRRKTIGLQVNPDGSLTVRAPIHLSQAEISSKVNAKKAWINEKQCEARKKLRESPPKRYVDGEKFLYLGNYYPLALVTNQAVPLKFNGQFYLSLEQMDDAEGIFEKWYRGEAKQVIGKRAAGLAERNNFRYSSIRITGAKTRWGSCGPKGSLNFPWRLVMAPLNVIDYVIVHELVHLRIRDHSKKYWNAVEQIMPDYRARLDWLNQNGHRLQLK